MATQSAREENERREEEEFQTGPLSVLTQSVKNNTQVEFHSKIDTTGFAGNHSIVSRSRIKHVIEGIGLCLLLGLSSYLIYRIFYMHFWLFDS